MHNMLPHTVVSLGVALALTLMVSPSVADRCGDDGPGVLVKAKRKPADTAWVEYRTRTVAHLQGFDTTAVDSGLSRYGSLRARTTAATGFFRTEKTNGRWWLVDPDGCCYVNVAVVGMSPGRGRRSKASLQEKYGGDKTVWADSATATLARYSFNGTGAWSNDKLMQAASRRTPYCPIHNFMSGYGKRRGGTFKQPGHTGYPHDLIFVFDPGFTEYCEDLARKLEATKDDPWLLGYFSDNEMPTPKNALDRYLRLPPDDHGYKAAAAWLAARQGGTLDTSRITRRDRDAFLGHVADTYYGTVARAIRRHDPNHLYLGSRINFFGLPADFYRAKGKHVDVVSINIYYQWQPHGPTLRKIEACAGKPVLVTEWYAKGDDVGFPNTSGAGWLVPTQNDRGLFYEHFTLGLLESRVCVGWQWFKYMDNDVEDSTAELSNRDANKGLVTVEHEVYPALARHMQSINRRVYHLCDFFDSQRARAPSAALADGGGASVSVRAAAASSKAERLLGAADTDLRRLWSSLNGAALTLTADSNSFPGRDRWDGRNDARVAAHVLHGSKGLYVLARVTDDAWVDVAHPRYDWKYDVLDVFLDSLPPASITPDRFFSTGNWALTPSSRQYKVWLGDSAVVAFARFVPQHWELYTDKAPVAESAARLDGLRVRVQQVDAAVKMVLVAIPWEHVGGRGGVRRTLAFTLGYNDMDADTGDVCSLRWKRSDPYSSESGRCSWGGLIVE